MRVGYFAFIYTNNKSHNIYFYNFDPMKSNTNHIVIMAGGIGSRFWPMSTPERPKQFIDVLGCGRTLIQLTADRFKGVCPPEHIWVVTSKSFASLVREQLPEIPKENILLEPCMRNTAPCIAYVAWKIAMRYPKANLVVTPADHVVMDTAEFRRVITSALSFTKDSSAILTLGMKPSRPETGYGYIEADIQSASPKNKEVYRVSAFREKPTPERAAEYIAQPNYYWNAGIFVWNVQTVIRAMRLHQPEIAEIMEDASLSFYSLIEQMVIDELFPKCKSISVDYAIMEKAKDMYVFPADFGWSDLGTWGSLHERTEKDASNNAAIGPNIHLIESTNCMVHTPENKKVVIQGLDGYIIAEKDNTLLICKLTEEQRIKEFSQMAAR